MKAVRCITELPLGRRVFALGNFDGVHLGHRAILESCVQIARQRQAVAVALAFHPHPLKVLGYPVQTINSWEEQVALIAETGIDALFAMPFDLQLAAMEPAQFVNLLLREGQADGIVVGFNYSFGRGGQGTPEFLRQALAPQQVPVEIVPPVLADGEPVSSTRIRRLLREGNLPMVSRLLGRPYSLTGYVTSGDQRGRLLGYPTANLPLSDERALPPFGAYVVEVVGLGFGIANLGIRPSYPQPIPGLEVHILNYNGNLYGQPIEVRPLQFLRQERHFASHEDLINQLEVDRQAAVAYLMR